MKQKIVNPANVIQVVTHQGPSWYRTMKSISMVPCDDGKYRTVYTVNGEGDTYFSMPAYTYVWDAVAKKNVKVVGSIYCRGEFEREESADKCTYTFGAYWYRKGARMLVSKEQLCNAYQLYPESFTYDPTKL